VTRRVLPLALVGVLLVADACSGGGAADDSPTTTAPPTEVEDDRPFPEDRCAANRAVGTITYLSSFDFAATASIVDVLVADARGYYDELCLDVEVQSSFSIDNYPLIAADEAQFASAGSFSEMVNFAGTNDAGFVALLVDGRIGIDTLIVSDPEVDDLTDLRGRTIGVKGALTPSVKAMLAAAGLEEGEDFEVLELEGFDPLEHVEIEEIAGFPGYRSNEPLALEAAGIDVRQFDPADVDVPGSFGVLYANRQFLDEHPHAAEDFVRATLRGLADAVAEPDEAVEIAVAALRTSGNTMGLPPRAELARWRLEAEILRSSSAVAPLGVPQLELLTAEVQTFTEIGLFDGIEPPVDDMVDAALAARLYSRDGELIWPSAD